MNRITAENETAVKRVLDDIFDNFDFENVKKAMDVLDWKWYDEDDEDAHVPSLDRIKQVAANLMWDLANDPENKVLGAGGFRVEKDFTDPDDPWMRLSFEVTDWDTSATELDN